MLDGYAESAKTLTLAGIIVEALLTVLFVFYFVLALGFLVFTTSTVSPPLNPPATTVTSGPGIYILIVIGLAFGIVGLLWVLLDYFLVYKRIKEEDIRGAKDTSLILGIVQLILGGVIPGILLIVAYTQLNNSFIHSQNRRENQA